MGIEDSVEKILAAERKRIWAEVREHQERLALIEQAKGILMFVYGLDADGAFSVLKSLSQHHNIELRLLAEQILKDMVELAREKEGPDRRIALDGLMLTAHHRISDVGPRQRDGQSKTGVPMKDL